MALYINSSAKALRSGVDDIRMMLRKERPESVSVDTAELKAQLNCFKISYNIDTELNLIGYVGSISPAIMLCIRDNMLEEMTNTVKHSNARKFSLNIETMNKIIREEIKDNGSTAEYM